RAVRTVTRHPHTEPPPARAGGRGPRTPTPTRRPGARGPGRRAAGRAPGAGRGGAPGRARARHSPPRPPSPSPSDAVRAPPDDATPARTLSSVWGLPSVAARPLRLVARTRPPVEALALDIIGCSANVARRSKGRHPAGRG